MKWLPYLVFLSLCLVTQGIMAGTPLEDVLRAKEAAEKAMKALVQAGKDGNETAKRKASEEYLKLWRRQRELEQRYFAENPTRTKGV
jgi:hypothetical protein